ncbi:MAG: hypothetical protein E7291_07980 [Lachnospiraceae bacterium]|nr:hypothetical protein [Lachnospiraceae bacterium]
MKKETAEMRNFIETRLKTRNLVLWGIGENAQQFYLTYKERYQITACVSSQMEHQEYLINEEDGLTITDWSQYVKNERDYIIILDEPYAITENQLLAEGFVLFEDYVERYIAEYIMSGKKLAIMAGNCQIVTASEFLRQIKSFTDEYYLLRFSSHYWKSRWSIKSLSLLKGMLDLYLCMYHEEGDPLFFSKEELPASCRVVTLPYAVGRPYWLQMKSGRKSAENEFYIRNKATSKHGPFEVGDININRMIAEGKGVEEIVSALTSEDFYTEEQVNEHIDMALRVLEYAEQECDIKILPYIRENYRKEMLYRDMTHMQPKLICEYARQILLYLGIDDKEIDEMLEKNTDISIYQKYSVHCTEVPVYPSVAKHMGLEWYHKDMTWDVTFYNGMRKLTFEEYIREYYNLCSKMKQILEEW